VKAGGDVDNIEGFGPYSKYLRVDEFANFIFSDVPDNLIPAVREWIKTEEGKKEGIHKENGGRNSDYEVCERLADKAYNVLGERYDIPKNLRSYFLISEGWHRPFDCYFDSLMPENLKSQAKDILRRVRPEFKEEQKKITDWMIKCSKANKIFPLEPIACTIL
jgi:hypothetical protein